MICQITTSGFRARILCFAASTAAAAPLPAAAPTTPQRRPLAAVLLLAATMYHLLGIHSETMIKDLIGRDVPISYGKVIHDIIA